MPRLRVVTPIALITALMMAAPVDAAGRFVEQDGAVVAEIEAEPANGSWNRVTSPSGFTGSAAYRWDGSNQFGSGGSGTLTYDILIQNAGNYQLLVRGRLTGSDPSEENDSWVRMDGQPISGQHTVNTNQWTKLYQNQAGVWSWHSRTKDFDPQPIRQFFSAGNHRIEFSGRSQGHYIDRFVLFKYQDKPWESGSDGASAYISTLDNLPQSSTSGGATTTTTTTSTTTTTTSTTTTTTPPPTTTTTTTTTTTQPQPTTTTTTTTTTTLPPFQGLLCTAAGDVDEIGGSMMTSTQFTAGGDKDANADALTTPLLFADSQVNSLSPNSGDVARYNVNLPQGGNWYIWGRFYYDDPAGNGANSFFAKFDSQAAKKFGNNRDFMNVWHYDGDGDVETGAPTALLLGNVSGGQHQVTIEKREVETVPPRLDVFCLAQIPDPAPTDEEVCQALGGCSAPTTTTSTTLSSSTTMFETTTTMFETTTTTSSTSTSTTMPVQIPGDLDGDGEVSASDALDGARAAVGSGTCAPCVCDLNGDGRVTIVDALIVLKLATGQTPEINPPACA